MDGFPFPPSALVEVPHPPFGVYVWLGRLNGLFQSLVGGLVIGACIPWHGPTCQHAMQSCSLYCVKCNQVDFFPARYLCSRNCLINSVHNVTGNCYFLSHLRLTIAILLRVLPKSPKHVCCQINMTKPYLSSMLNFIPPANVPVNNWWDPYWLYKDPMFDMGSRVASND